MSILHMEIDVVRAAARQIRQAAEEIRQQSQIVHRGAFNADWIGSARDQFVAEVDFIVRQMDAQTDAAMQLAQRVENEIAEWEGMATDLFTVNNPFYGEMTDGATGNPLLDFDVPDWAVDYLGALDKISWFNSYVLNPALFFSAVSIGKSYSGQVIVHGSKLFKFWGLGINPNFTHGTAKTLLKAAGTQFGTSGGAKLLAKSASKTFILVGLASDWVQDYDTYRSEGTAHVASAFIYDAVKASAGIGGAKLGMAIGTAICPGVGTLVGAAVGGLVSEVAFGDSIWRLMGESNPIKDWAIDEMSAFGESSGLIPTVDQMITNSFNPT